MDTIRTLLEEKGDDVWSIDPDSSVHDAVRLMVEQDLGALAVVVEERLVGMISERDCARNIVLGDKPAKDTPVREVMTSNVVYARPGQRMEECMAVMNERQIRHLPVIQNDKLIAMISLRDLVNAIVKEQNMKIEELDALSFYHGT